MNRTGPKFERVRVKWRRNWLKARAWLGRPAVLAAARRSAPGLYHVVVPPRVLDTYEETVHGIADALRAHSRDAVVHCVDRMEQVAPLRAGDRVLVFGAHRYAPWRPPPGVLLIGVNVEQYPAGWTPGGSGGEHMAKTDRFLAGCDVLLECNECLLEESARLGRPAAGVLSFAWTPRLDHGLPPLDDPPYDVAFLGRPGEGRRKEALERLAREFKLAPTTVAWGRARGEFLRRARIQINLHQGEKPVLEGHRFALCLANGAFVLSEPLPPAAPFRAGVHYAEASLADFPVAIRHYLSHPADRQRIAADGRRYFREEYTLERAVGRLLPVIDARSIGRSPDSSASVASEDAGRTFHSA
jgi:hypothetical protein